MMIRLTKNGKALVKMMRSETCRVRKDVLRPRMKEYTLIRVDGRGRILCKEKVLIEENRYFKAA